MTRGFCFHNQTSKETNNIRKERKTKQEMQDETVEENKEEQKGNEAVIQKLWFRRFNLVHELE